MKAQKRRRNVKKTLVFAFIVAAIIFGALMLQKYQARHLQPTGPVQPQPAGTVLISLFFATPDGQGLAQETREIDSCSSDLAICMQDAIEALVSGPLGDLAPTLPVATVVNSVQVTGDTAVIDFNKELVNGLPGGSSAEITAVYSIVDTISFNFAQIKKVKFLVDGHDVETLVGHLDLRAPLAPDFQLVQKKNAQPAVPVK
jgi:hypothetical protein